MHQLLSWLALPQFGLSTVFIVALISATLLPLGSEPAVVGLLQLNPDLFWQTVFVATAGNTLGGAISWWMGLGAHKAWRFVHARRGEFAQVVPTAMRVNNAEGLAPALRAGLGLALQPEFLAWEDLQSGALQTCMDDWQVPSIALHIVTPPGRARPARVQALIDFLAAHFALAPWAREPQA